MTISVTGVEPADFHKKLGADNGFYRLTRASIPICLRVPKPGSPWIGGILLLVVILLGACRQSNSISEEIPASEESIAPPPPTVTSQLEEPTKSVSKAEALPTPVSAARPSSLATPSRVPSDTPPPIQPYTIAGLRAANYAGGTVQIRYTLETTADYTRYYIEYPSDDLTITGIMQVPPGEGPYPVIILLHGYFERDQYWSGADTWQAAEFLNRRGYLTIAPDLRSWGGSDSGLSLFHTGLVRDSLNLISALPSLPQADPSKVGLWGHSMGGGLVMKMLTINDRIRVAVLYAPNSADDADLIARWGPGCLPGQSEAAGDKCNPAEIIPPDTPTDLVDASLAAARDPAWLQQIAAIYHLNTVNTPIQIHIGTADGQSLGETPPEWSEKLFNALQTAGKDASYFVYPGQGHFFGGESWQRFMERTVSFYDDRLY